MDLRPERHLGLNMLHMYVPKLPFKSGNLMISHQRLGSITFFRQSHFMASDVTLHGFLQKVVLEPRWMLRNTKRSSENGLLSWKRLGATGEFP